MPSGRSTPRPAGTFAVSLPTAGGDRSVTQAAVRDTGRAFAVEGTRPVAPVCEDTTQIQGTVVAREPLGE